MWASRGSSWRCFTALGTWLRQGIIDEKPAACIARGKELDPGRAGGNGGNLAAGGDRRRERQVRPCAAASLQAGTGVWQERGRCLCLGGRFIPAKLRNSALGGGRNESDICCSSGIILSRRDAGLRQEPARR